MARYRVAVIGSAGTVFMKQIVQAIQDFGDIPIVVTFSFESDRLQDGTQVISVKSSETPSMRALRKTMRTIESRYLRLRDDKYRAAMKEYGSAKHSFVPIVSSSYLRGRLIAAEVNKLRPDYVFGLEAFQYGAATALSGKSFRVLMPWGGDIYNYADTSPFALRLVRWSLQNCELISPSATSAISRLTDRFGISEDKIYPVSWGVDQDTFRLIGSENRREICRNFGIDPDATIVTNARRFHPAWGSDIALRAFIALTDKFPHAHFVIVGNSHTADEAIKAARAMIASSPNAARITLLEREISQAQMAELLSISHIFTSLVLKPDMRSATILEGAASGSAPVVTDQPEYREMEKLGFTAQFVKPTVESVFEAVSYYLTHPEECQQVIEQNLQYVRTWEDRRVNLTLLFNRIHELVEKRSAEP